MTYHARAVLLGIYKPSIFNGLNKMIGASNRLHAKQLHDPFAWNLAKLVCFSAARRGTGERRTGAPNSAQIRFRRLSPASQRCVLGLPIRVHRAPLSQKPPISTLQPPSSLHTQMTAQTESTSSASSAAGTGTPKKLPAVEGRKTAESQPTTVPSASKALKSGRQTYVAKCSACHSSDGSGTGTIGKSMRIPSLTSPQVQRQDDETLASVISNA